MNLAEAIELAKQDKETIDRLREENEQLKEDIGLLKYQNELLSDELEQAKAVINKKWSEYLKKKELEE